VSFVDLLERVPAAFAPSTLIFFNVGQPVSITRKMRAGKGASRRTKVRRQAEVALIKREIENIKCQLASPSREN
jgi:hypothetical protein